MLMNFNSSNLSTEQNQLQNIAFLGLGSMGYAILSGLLKTAQGARMQISATTNSEKSAAGYKNLDAAKVSSVEGDPQANIEAVRDAQLVMLCVKPWSVTEMLREIAADLAENAVVVSVAAGVTTAAMQKALGDRDDARVVRAMPNTPALVGKGVTGIAAASDVPAAAVELAQNVFECVGDVVVVDESEIDALSAISGSGPAYVFWFTEQLMDAAERAGFSSADAKLLAEQTVIGAAALMADSNKTPAQLRKAVTSPGGTTEKALEVFNAADPAALFDSVVAAAARKAAQLAAENK